MAGIMFQVTGMLTKVESKAGGKNNTMYHTAEIAFMGGSERLNLDADLVKIAREGMNCKVTGEINKRFNENKFDVKKLDEIK